MQSSMSTAFASANMANAMESMNAVGSHISAKAGVHAATIEMLHHAVCSMKPHHVKHMLHSGVNVNEPIDKEGHTILDAFAVEHQGMLKQLLNLKVNSEEKTKIFYSNQENAR